MNVIRVTTPMYTLSELNVDELLIIRNSLRDHVARTRDYEYKQVALALVRAIDASITPDEKEEN